MTLPASLRAGLSSSHIPALDGLRAIAVSLVVLYHFASASFPGGLGVLIFFVLSGFLITGLLLDENQKYGTVSLRRFYIRRSLRIFPAFFAYWLLVVGGLLMFHKRLLWGQVWASFFYVNNYYQAILGDPNTALSHTWSLSVEEQFYLLWPLSFLWLRADLRRASRFVLGLIVVLELYRFLLYFAHVHAGYDYEAFETRADSLLVGCLLAILLRSNQHARYWSWLCDKVWKPLLPIALLALSSAAFLKYGETWRNLFGLLIEPWLVAILIVQFIALSVASPVWGWLNSKPVVFLGRLSYSIYLYQQIMSGFAGKIFPQNKGLFLLVAIADTILVASASYYVIERPFLRLRDRFTGSRPAQDYSLAQAR